jgi:PAS domain S-box-containing protein
VGKNIWEVIPALRKRLEPLFRRVLDGGETIAKLQMEAEVPVTPGIRRYWEVSYYPVYDETDEVVALCGIVDEISDRKAAEKERANSEARLQRLMDANLFGVATATTEGIIDCNDAYLNIIGYSRDDFLQQGIDWRKITPPEHLPYDMAGLEQLKQTGICAAFEKEYIRKDSRRVPVLIGATVLDYEPLQWISFIIDLSEQKASEEKARQLSNEMAHRTKNLLTVVSAIARQLAQTSGSLEEFTSRFSARLAALGGIHDLLVRDNWRGATVRDLALAQLAHCADLVGRRILLEGGTVSLNATACQYLGMALHELSTNAIKHGALSNDAGTVTIKWSQQPPENPESFTIDWIEQGGPRVKSPTRQGYGRRVTTQFIAHALNARVSEQFREKGLRWSLVMPTSFLLTSAAQTQTAAA